MTTGDPPEFCPFCASPLHVVRHIIATMYETMCESCERTAVISIDDAQELPSAAIRRERA
jgi:hypothetical protein